MNNTDRIKKIRKTINLIEGRIKDINSEIENFETDSGKIKENHSISESSKEDVLEMKESASKLLIEIKDVHLEIIGDERNIGIRNKLEELLDNFKEASNKIKTKEQELFGYEEEKEDGTLEEVNGLFDKINSFFDLQKERYNSKFKEIEEKLLPGATTVGLAFAYEDKYKSYEKANYTWLFVFFFSVSLMIFIMLNLYFGFFGESFFTSLLNETSSIKKGENSLNRDIFFIHLLSRFLINAGIVSALVWLATFTTKRYSQNRRLAEEYSYKATFAKSFEGYRKLAEELDENSKALSENLMFEMIKVSSFNPVQTMDNKYHKHSHPSLELIEEVTKKIINKMKL